MFCGGHDSGLTCNYGRCFSCVSALVEGTERIVGLYIQLARLVNVDAVNTKEYFMVVKSKNQE
jgi:hypothetical protein